MHKTREILRQKWELGRTHRQIAESAGVSAGVVGMTASRAKAAGVTWSEVCQLDDDALEDRLYGRRPLVSSARPMPDFAAMHIERHKPGVTLDLLHVEYLAKHPDGYSRTQFCDLYRQWLARQRLTMRQVHRAGEKMFVDYAGRKPKLVDPKTGATTEAELFVAVLGASNYTFAEATLSQRGPDWIESHVRAFEDIGGVPGAVVCDQLKSGVTTACRYEPGVQRTYEEMAQHYGTTVLPARPAHPKDKAKVEVAVQVVERWILARLRHQTFFSLAELNHRIGELLDDINSRVMRRYQKSRRQLFEELDRPALRPLPSERFSYAEWRYATVNIDYHIEVERHYYSVPHPLVHERVEARVSATMVEVFHRARRVAAHRRSFEGGRHTTIPEHMPKAHQQHLDWTPSRFCRWAADIGPYTEELVRSILAERPHPEQGYRSCLGILRLGRRYGHG
ncbi:MAG: IS21 family transposase, partial [Polyangiaceae bacterium]|nr:IS21 family transposase [Polyangiaceae bacterium]